MSERPIQKGDLVVVTKPRRCGCVESLGKVFVVDDMEPVPFGTTCIFCGAAEFAPEVVAYGSGAEWICITLPRLKRIPPAEELEGKRTEEPLRVPQKEPA